MQLREAMTRVYHVTKPYWAKERVHVDEGYRNLTGADTLTDLKKVCRDDRSHFTDTEATFGDWVGYIRTWSGLTASYEHCPFFQKYAPEQTIPT